MALCDLPRGCWAVIADIDPADQALAPLADLGFVAGARLRPTHSGPGGDPRVYEIDGAQVALRRAAAQRILVDATGQPHRRRR
jgi:ferrous iron transport protein A